MGGTNDSGRRYGVVEVSDGHPRYALVDQNGDVVEPVTQYLLELLASDSSPSTIKSYAFALLDWYRFLACAGVPWDRAERQHVRDYVLRLRSADNPYRRRTRTDSPAPGTLNQRTGKAYLAAGYAPATINHRLSVIRSFYAFHMRDGHGPLINPVPTETRTSSRRGAHHRPGDPWVREGRSPYRQRLPKREPRAITDDLWEEAFAALRKYRDRAILCLLVSSGARAQELLSMTGADVDWGRQRVCLVTKGTRSREWVAASPEFFWWLARYLTERGPVGSLDPLWTTVRRPYRPLNYQALRAVIVRVNERLKTNLVLHDMRHTCALRLATDPAIPITDVQTHMRHRHLTSTEIYLVARPEEVIARVQAHHRAERRRVQGPAKTSVWNYDSADLEVLRGDRSR